MSTHEPSRYDVIADMLRADDFFEEGFPKQLFRTLLWEEAENETNDWDRKVAWQDMAVFWRDADFLQLRCWLQSQPDRRTGAT